MLIHFYSLIFIYLLFINIFALIAYGIDKRKGRHHQWRIPEAFLMALALFGGSWGATIGMLWFHHKTHHKKFYIGVPILLVAWTVCLLSLVAHHHNYNFALPF